MIDVSGRPVSIVGAARSGVAAAHLLARAGAQVFLTDRGPVDDTLRASLEAAGVTVESGGHTERALEADFVVISPGVPTTTPLIQTALGNGLAVYSEIEVASWFCRAPIVAVTGSNGKTTTTSLLGYLFAQAGYAAHVAGNIGFPFSDVAMEAKPDEVVVLEVSSFQLDHIDTFRPRVSVVLNITPDHLDRYGYRFEAYAASKFRLFENQGEGDVLVYNIDDPVLAPRAEAAARTGGVTLAGFSLGTRPETGAGLDGTELVLRYGGEEIRLMDKTELALPGRHNLYNALAAAMAARAMDVAPGRIRESLSSFAGVPHRLEFVRELDGVRYINDSKATNVDAVWYALESMTRPVILIAGGRDKGNDYNRIKPLVRDRVRAVIALGESAETVMRELGALAPEAVEATSMADAVETARRLSKPGDVVLLSPACASFDLFKNYEHRGDLFRELVRAQ
ncbi:MAG: UDP-N-acetylmuramoyl-L-alanine--D-glutamate ligase [Rhodothermales bacterium]